MNRNLSPFLKLHDEKDPKKTRHDVKISSRNIIFTTWRVVIMNEQYQQKCYIRSAQSEGWQNNVLTLIGIYCDNIYLQLPKSVIALDGRRFQSPIRSPTYAFHRMFSYTDRRLNLFLWLFLLHSIPAIKIQFHS